MDEAIINQDNEDKRNKLLVKMVKGIGQERGNAWYGDQDIFGRRGCS